MGNDTSDAPDRTAPDPGSKQVRRQPYEVRKLLEARARIELANKGFADLEVVPLTPLFSVSLVSDRCLLS
jgi:hypothetical protein